MGRKSKLTVVQRFDHYFGSGTLEDWQRLCGDIGLEGDLASITQCRKALRSVYVNIHDLLDAVDGGCTPPQRFRNLGELRRYTLLSKPKKVFPKEAAKKRGPVRALLRPIF